MIQAANYGKRNILARFCGINKMKNL